MIIRKQLKGVTFEYDTDYKQLEIINKFHSGYVTRQEMISLMRFGLRILQKGKPRK
mgnify:CR=1 FL=1